MRSLSVITKCFRFAVMRIKLTKKVFYVTSYENESRIVYEAPPETFVTLLFVDLTGVKAQ